MYGNVIPPLHLLNSYADSVETNTYFFRLNDVHNDKISINIHINVQQAGGKYMTLNHTTKFTYAWKLKYYRTCSTTIKISISPFNGVY